MYNILMRLIKTTRPKPRGKGLPQAHRNQENEPSAPASRGTACMELSPLGARSEGKLCSALHEEHPPPHTHTHMPRDALKAWKRQFGKWDVE